MVREGGLMDDLKARIYEAYEEGYKQGYVSGFEAGQHAQELLRELNSGPTGSRLAKDLSELYFASRSAR